MDNSINNVSFKANLATRIKGRHEIIDKVGKRFAEKTAGIDGSLRFSRARTEIVGSNVSAFEFSTGSASYYVSEGADKLLGNNLKSKEDVNPTVIEKITDTFVNIFKALRTEAKFTERIKSIEENIKSTKKAYRKNVNLAKLFGEKGEVFNVCANSNKKRLEVLNSQCAKEKEAFLKEANEIGKDEPYLDVWHTIINEDCSL